MAPVVLGVHLDQSPEHVPGFGEPALLNTPETWAGFQALLPEGAIWENRCAARIALTIHFYRPASSVTRISCPALIIYAENDSLISAASVGRAAARMPQATPVMVPQGHFDIYTGEAFEAASEMQAEFLELHLRSRRPSWGTENPTK